MHRIRKFLGLTVLAVMATASPAIAQVCAGFPMATGSTSLVGGLSFPDNANGFAIGVQHKANEAVVVGVAYELTTFDEIFGVELPSMHNFAANAAYEIPLAATNTGADLAVCPEVGFGYGRWDELNILTVPLGVSFGAAFRAAQGSTIVAPFISPYFVWQRVSADGESESADDLGFTLGSNFLVSNFLFGFGYTKIGDADGTFGIRFGMIF